MMPHLVVIALVTTAVIVTPAIIYLFSADSARRTRAWRLLRLLFGR